MGNILLRTAPGTDTYVVWSTVVDEPIFVGTRAEVEEYLVKLALADARHKARKDLQNAAGWGSSVRHRLPGQEHYTGSWEDDSLPCGPLKWLPRDRLDRYIELWRNDKYDEATALLEDLGAD